MFKLVAFAFLVASTRAGVPVGYQPYAAAPAVSHAYFSAPTVAKVAYNPYQQVAPVAYNQVAPIAYNQVAPVAYHQAPTYAYAPKAYASPVISKAYASPVISKGYVAEPVAPAVYEFAYAVNDPHTGDSKSQQESRNGDVVHGSYSLVEADGTKRVVEYSADAHSGFNAVVHKEGQAVAKVVAPVAKVAPLSYSYAPTVAKYAAPGYYH